MSAKYVSRAWDLDVKATHKIILLALADNANQTGDAVLGLAKLSKLSGLGVDTCSLALKTLENQGFIATTRCGNRPSLVTLVFGESEDTAKSTTSERLRNGTGLATRYKTNVIPNSYQRGTPYLRLVSRAEQSRGEQSRGEQSRGEESRGEESRLEPAIKDFGVAEAGEASLISEKMFTVPTSESPSADGAGPAKFDDVSKVFEYWRAKLHPRARLGTRRKAAVERALKLYSAEDLILAVDGCLNSPFHMGENKDGRKFTDLELIVRDEKHVEQFMEMAENPPVKINSAKEREQQNKQVMQEWLEEDGPQPAV